MGRFVALPGRRSILGQILLPIVILQALAIGLTATATALLAASRAEREIASRLDGMMNALGRANFPFTPGVLQTMRGLSGAHFVARDAEGRVTATTLPGAVRPPEALGNLPLSVEVGSLGASATIEVAGERYLAVSLRPTGDPRGGSLAVLYPETSWREARREAAAPPLVLGAVALAAMSAITGLVARRIGGRVGRLRGRVARIAAGDFTPGDDPNDSDGDEVADLSRSIDIMCAQIVTMQREIRLAERSRVLGQLAAGLAHQLRNALTGARMSVQLHAKRCRTHGDDRSLAVAVRQLQITEEQVKGLLSLASAERRAPEVCDAREIVADVAELLGPTCQHARVTLRHDTEAGPLNIRVDRSGVRAAVLNLALNAVEAAGVGGTVGLRVAREGRHVAVEVNDDGPGPPAHLAEHLFDPFVTGKPEGVGIGLAIASQVANAQGGRLTWVRDGERTRFLLELPEPNGAAETSP